MKGYLHKAYTTGKDRLHCYMYMYIINSRTTTKRENACEILQLLHLYLSSGCSKKRVN